MAQITIQQQEELMQQTKKFVAKYGISKKWLASKVGISIRGFSLFINARFAITQHQYDKLRDFIDEYDRRMVGFVALDN
ncbi:hypothetical protein D7X94_04705 [Acutalibacter sp. 1XD8-33]|uniref:hypothetical protein n=1 Tax=Acutalibacter sp. 1XD8-33 TaxID=2320081 RepID=UPI000EA2CE46|nr:hypothetical protein [Acutalibacter sp. 1XD8-33]RKJ41111.1 hypothetical protein D7X94_04705 [Acutalibacter sp. 1XD8-33]